MHSVQEISFKLEVTSSGERYSYIHSSHPLLLPLYTHKNYHRPIRERKSKAKSESRIYNGASVKSDNYNENRATIKAVWRARLATLSLPGARALARLSLPLQHTHIYSAPPLQRCSQRGCSRWIYLSAVAARRLA